MKHVIYKYFNIFKSNVTPGEDVSQLHQFEKDRQKTLLQAVQIGAALCILLVPIFGVLDILIKHNRLPLFLIIRLVVTFIAFIILIFGITKFGSSKPYALGAILTIVVGGSIALMCHLDQGPIDPYYAGINLPLLGFGILLPLKLRESILVFIGVWLIYFIPNLALVTSQNIGIFISNNFFMLASILLAVVSSQFHLYYLRNIWLSRYNLEEANKKIKNYSKDLEYKVQERSQKLLQSERLAVVGQLVGGIAHDFNNFLTAILGVSDLILRQKNLKKQIVRDVESIYHAGMRASAMVKQLLTFSRQQTYDPQWLELNNIIQQTRQMLERIIGEDIELLFYQQEDLGVVLADPIQIEQIILNLAVNARDAMPHGGQLIIETSHVKLDSEYCYSRDLKLVPGTYVMLAISDTGEGMSNETKSKIFEPFFTTKERGKGTGLGLSSVYGIVKQMQGVIHVYSEISVGSMFKIFLPCKSNSQQKKQEPNKKSRSLPRGKETILLVEDEDSVRHLTARLLKRQGYKIIEAKAGQEAITLAQAHQNRIDLLVTDVIMPRMNGKELAEHLSTKIMDLKVLYMSGYTNIFIANQGFIGNSTAFLQKPFTIETLSMKVRNIFDN
ncbi:response regulator [bacterium]